MRRIALVLVLLANGVLGTGMPLCCILETACASHRPAKHEERRCKCCPPDKEEAPPAPASPKPCPCAAATSVLWHAGHAVALDAALPVAFADAVPPLPMAGAPERAPCRESGPPGPAVRLPLLL